MKSLLLAAATSLCLPATAQVYKCPDASGRTVIQQIPCAGGKSLDVKPASGHGLTAPASSAQSAAGGSGAGASAPARPMTEAERLNAKSDASAKERRRRELNDIFVPEARAAVFQHRDSCKRRQAELKAKQYEYVQNLYGKTHAAQIASEMAAQSAQCDTKDREMVSHFNTLLTECRGLKGCAAITPP